MIEPPAPATTPGADEAAASVMVTVCLDAPAAERLDTLIPLLRQRHPGADDNAVVDAIFLAGLEAAQLLIDSRRPAP